MRVRLQQRRPSKSAYALSKALGIKRLKRSNSKFTPKPGDVIVNWGLVDVLPHATYLNPPSAVELAADKLATFKCLTAHGIATPNHQTFKPTGSDLWLARTTLHGHSGDGIVLATPDQLPSAPLYTQHIPKVAEYRAIVVNGQVVDFKQKLKRRPYSDENPTGHVGEHHPHVWSYDNGYIFAREGIERPADLDTISINTMQALGLNYGALDIIKSEDGKLYILEVNTAFGLDGSTTSLVASAIQRLIYELV
jgi:glutathione synthase/RimK-type ligase-like ATP-grasp enzyme